MKNQHSHKILHHRHDIQDTRNHENQNRRLIETNPAIAYRSNYDNMDSDYINQNLDARNAENEGDYAYDNDMGNMPYAQKKKRHAKKEQQSKIEAEEDNDNSFGYNNYDFPDNENKNIKSHKRNIPAWSKEQISALKRSLAAIQENSNEFEHLQQILSDMGLIEGNHVKRESLEEELEDENLNTKEITMKRNVKKRSNNDKAEEQSNERTSEEKRKAEKDTDNSAKAEKMDKKKAANHEKSASETKKADDDRKKRESQSSAEAQVNEIVKKVAEKSIELTPNVKNPLPSNNLDPKALPAEAETEKEKLNKRNAEDEYAQYEQMIESQIEEKINAIKEKVKRAIMGQKQHVRTKRHSLLDSENKNLNLISKESLVPHIRTRRKVETSSKKQGTTNERSEDTTEDSSAQAENLTVQSLDKKIKQQKEEESINMAETCRITKIKRINHNDSRSANKTSSNSTSTFDFPDEDTFLLLPDEEPYENDVTTVKQLLATTGSISALSRTFYKNCDPYNVSKNLNNTESEQSVKHFFVNNSNSVARRKRDLLKTNNYDSKQENPNFSKVKFLKRVERNLDDKEINEKMAGFNEREQNIVGLEKDAGKFISNIRNDFVHQSVERPRDFFCKSKLDVTLGVDQYC